MIKKRCYSGIGADLKTARKAGGFLQSEIAAAVGLTIPTVRQAENGGGYFSGFLACADYLGREIAGRSLPQGDSIGERLAVLRDRQKISYRRLSALTKISPPTLAAIEADTIGHLAAFEKVAEVLGAGLFLHPKGAPLNFYRTAGTSSAFQAWTTPPDLLAKLYPIMGGCFDLDPCSATTDRKAATVKARIYFTGQQGKENGLLLPWFGSVFVNPPYGRTLKYWVKKCLGLIPARPDTNPWRIC